MPNQSPRSSAALLSHASSIMTHINDSTQRSNRIRPVHDITPYRCGVFHDTAGYHDHILSLLAQLFDHEIHHLPEGSILVLEELGDAEEEGRSFLLWELLASKEEEGDLGEDDAAAAGGDGGGVEDAG